jgi:hypothetical protein
MASRDERGRARTCCSPVDTMLLENGQGLGNLGFRSAKEACGYAGKHPEIDTSQAVNNPITVSCS